MEDSESEAYFDDSDVEPEPSVSDDKPLNRIQQLFRRASTGYRRIPTKLMKNSRSFFFMRWNALRWKAELIVISSVNIFVVLFCIVSILLFCIAFRGIDHVHVAQGVNTTNIVDNTNSTQVLDICFSLLVCSHCTYM